MALQPETLNKAEQAYRLYKEQGIQKIEACKQVGIATSGFYKYLRECRPDVQVKKKGKSGRPPGQPSKPAKQPYVVQMSDGASGNITFTPKEFAIFCKGLLSA